MTEGLRDDRAEYHKHVRGENRLIPSFPTPDDQVEGDVKDMVYQLRESLILSFPIHRESPLGTQMRFRFFDRNDRRLEDDETEYHRPFRERIA